MQCFPNAEGWGSDTTHGRFGDVYFMDVLDGDANGVGTLRAAVEATGPRTLVPRVSGIVNVSQPMKLESPGLYIAGQASPGGLVFKGEEWRVQTSDILLRYFGIYPGADDEPADGYDNRDCITFGHPAVDGRTHDCILDHISGRFAVDESLSVWYDSFNITVCWSMFAEALNFSKHPKTLGPPFQPHSMGLLVGAGANHVTLHHILDHACRERNFQLAGCLTPALEPSHSIVGVWWNTISDYGQEQGAVEQLGNEIDFVGNRYMLGPDFTAPNKKIVRFADDAPDAKVYAKLNVGPTNNDPTADSWEMFTTDHGTVPPRAGHQVDVPFGPVISGSDPFVESARVLSSAGMHKNPINMNSAEARTIQQIRTQACRPRNAKYFIDSPTQVGGWPLIVGATYPTDSNNDGVPDYYATERGFSVMTDIHDVAAPSGFTYLEEYLESLIVPP